MFAQIQLMTMLVKLKAVGTAEVRWYIAFVRLPAAGVRHGRLNDRHTVPELTP